jgi:hypothetical protein
MKVYISGPITGIKDYNRDAFNLAEQKLIELGHKVVNPLRGVKVSDKKTWADYMKTDIRLLTKCNAIYLLKGFENSRGARLEYKIAMELGYKIMGEGLLI